MSTIAPGFARGSTRATPGAPAVRLSDPGRGVRANIGADNPPPRAPRTATPPRAAVANAGTTMIGILIVAHDTLGESLVRAVTHVLGGRPPQFEAFAVAATDDPLLLLPRAREAVARLDTGDGVVVFSDIF